jgi:hypothetical protein
MRLLNNFENWYLQLKMWFLSRKPIEGERKVLPPSDYKLIFEDNFDNSKLSDDWRISQPWGEFHSDNLKQYWPTDNSCVYITSEGLMLDLRNIPKTYKKSELPPWQQKPELPDEFTIDWAAGLVLLKQPYKFGWFESYIQLPTNKSQWAAFWLSGSESWPPEIDVFESYTYGNVDNITIKPNIHWGKVEDNTKKSYGAPRICVKDPHKRYVQYVVHWTEEFIKFYYDGELVQVCKDKKMLSDNSVTQNIILNNGVNVVKGVNPDESSMIVKYFRIYQKK